MKHNKNIKCNNNSNQLQNNIKKVFLKNGSWFYIMFIIYRNTLFNLDVNTKKYKLQKLY